MAGALIGADLFGTGWRAVFLLNVPLGALALLGAWRVLPHERPTGTGRLDTVGAVLLSLSALAVIYPLVEGRDLAAVQQLAAAVGVAVVATVFFALQHQPGSAQQAMARTALLTLVPVALTAVLAFQLPRTVRESAER